MKQYTVVLEATNVERARCQIRQLVTSGCDIVALGSAKSF